MSKQINFEKENDDLKNWQFPEKRLKWIKSIAARVEAETIQRCWSATNCPEILLNLLRIYDPELKNEK